MTWSGGHRLKRRISPRLFAVALIFTGGWMQAAGAQSDSRLIIYEEVSYGPLAAQKLDVCIPVDANRAPAVVMIHGGNWRFGDKRGFRGPCRLAALRGVVAASINYRLASDEDNRWPAQIVDVQLAVRWLRANADRFHIDAGHICAWGSSAGAHLAVFAGTAKRTIPGDFANELNRISSAVACVVDDAGPVDLTDPDYRPPDRQLFGSPGRTAELERAMSPLFQVGTGDPPTLVVHGRSDPLVPVEQAERLVQALQKSSVPVQAIFHTGGHGIGSLAPEKQRAIVQAEIAFITSPRSTSATQSLLK